jgi:hypothetical protein
MNNVALIEDFFQKHILKLFLLIAATTILLAIENYNDYHAYKIGDWLINYQAGFIRRGFFGEFIFILHEASSIDLGVILIFFQIITYLLIFFLIFRLIEFNKDYFSYSLVLISPFFLLFHIADYQGGFRKEILYFLLLSYLVYLSHLNKESFTKMFYFSILIFPILILTHEMLALYLPYLLIAYFMMNKINYINSFRIGVMLIPSAIAFLYAVSYEPNPVQINEMISKINAIYPVEPSGILWLDKNLYQALEYTNKMIRDDYYIFYFFLLLIVTFSLIPLKNKIKLIFKENINIFLFIVMISGTIILSLVAIDWGRFIYIHLFSLILLTLINKDDISHKKCDSFSNYVNNISLVKCKIIYFSYAFLWYFPHMHPLKGVTRPLRSLEGILAPYLKLFFT